MAPRRRIVLVAGILQAHQHRHLVVKTRKLLKSVDGDLKLRNRGPAVCFNALIPLPVIVVDSALFNTFQERMVKVKTVAKMASNAIFGKWVLDERISIIIETTEHFESLFQYSKVFLL